MFGPFALTAASLFAGAAIYVTWAEHPARLTLDDRALLAQWGPSYERGLVMQGALALVGGVLGIIEWLVTGRSSWLLGGLILLANWPYTLYVIMPVNNQLKAVPVAEAGEKTRLLLVEWGRLHAVRSALGAASVIVFLWASI